MWRAYKQENGYIFISSLQENVKQLKALSGLCFDFVSDMKIIIQLVLNMGLYNKYIYIPDPFIQDPFKLN